MDMVGAVVIGLTAIALSLMVWIFIRVREAVQVGEDLAWYMERYKRALRQLESEERAEVLAGLQVLAVLKDPRLQVTALPRVELLTESKDPRISEYARRVMKMIAVNLGESMTGEMEREQGVGRVRKPDLHL